MEFEIQSPLRWRLRLGRVQLRTWRSRVIILPRGYREPTLVYEVVRWNEDTEAVEALLGAFDSEAEAHKLIELLDGEGRHGMLRVNLVTFHARLEDWRFDR